MKLSGVFIQRPVLATAMTLIMVLFGLLSYTALPVREFPDIDAPMVSVRTVYPGAGARIVEMEVTTVLEEAISGIERIKTISSVSREEVSQITIEFDPKRDLDAAANDVRDRVFSVRRQLPHQIEEPIISKARADADPIISLSLMSDRHDELELTDFAERYLKDRLSTLPGVSTVQIWGERRYAMRLWLSPDRLAARRLTVQDVEQALQSQNVTAPSGRIESTQREFSVRTRGELQTAAQFNRMIVSVRGDYPTRLEEVGYAEVGAEDDRKLTRLNGRPTLGLGVVKQSKANALAVGRAVKEKLPELQRSLPVGITLQLAFDNTLYIERSLWEVCLALALSVLLVVLVVFLFLGSARATLIPAVTIPVSLIGGFSVMQLFGCSLNLLTLLGLVLAVGLVVDDAIVVLENIHRRMGLGEPPLMAALNGTREIGFAVIATTCSLVAVFIPIAFLPGLTGRLFAELAVTIAGMVLISGVIALTVTPMMTAWILNKSEERHAPRRLQCTLQHLVGLLVQGYRAALTWALQVHAVVVVGSAITLGGCCLWLFLPAELVPEEDMGAFFISLEAPEGATLRYTDQYTRDVEALLAQIPEVKDSFTWVASELRPTIVSRAGVLVTLKDWDARSRSQQEIVVELQRKLDRIAGVLASAVQPSALGQWGDEPPVQLVMGGLSYEELARMSAILLEQAKANPGLMASKSDLNLNKPELDVHVHRDKAAVLGIPISAIAHTLDTLLGGRPVTTFLRDGREYRVILKIQDGDRMKPADISALYMRNDQGHVIQLSNLVTLEETVVPRELNHYDKMRAVTVSAGLAPGYTVGQALTDLERLARSSLPAGTPLTYAGESKEFKGATDHLPRVFVFALLLTYLVLAAEFEHFLHPLIILLSVPPALAGALLTLTLRGGSLNLYSEIGFIMLIGLVIKNAILIVDFANQLRARGMDVWLAIIEASVLRFRPILMTTFATILGAVPLVLATGPGAASRRQLGSVVIGGLGFSTLVTLFLVPAVYLYFTQRSVKRVLSPALFPIAVPPTAVALAPLSLPRPSSGLS